MQRIYLDNPASYVQAALVRAQAALFTESSDTSEASSSPASSSIEWVTPTSSPDSFAAVLPSLDAVIIDLTDSIREQSVLSALTAISSATLDRPLLVLGLSSFLSSCAAASKRALKESGYQQRRAPAQFAALKTLESAALGLANDGVTVRIVAPGVVYGEGEDLLLPLLRAAWMGEALPLVGKGDNAVPAIHVKDLCTFLLTVIASPPDASYLYASEPASTTQADLVTAISTRLGTGSVEGVDLATASLSSTTPAPLLAALTADVRLDSETLRSAEMEWSAKDGFVASVGRVVEEFVRTRRAEPVRVWVTGPPCSGKSRWSRAIAARYHLPVLSISELIEDARTRGDDVTAEIDAELKDAEDKAAALAKDAAKKPSAKRATVTGKVDAVAEAPRALLSVAVLTKLVKRRMAESQVRNQGYVLDGYPRTKEEAEALFVEAAPTAEEAEAETTEADEPTEEKEAAAEGEGAADAVPAEAAAAAIRLNTATAPASIIAIQASEAFAGSWLQRLSYAELQPGHNDEEGLKRRWSHWEQTQKSGQSAVELLASCVDVLELSEAVVQGEDRAWQLLLVYLTKGGKRENFHPTPAEAKAEAEARLAEEARQHAEEEQMEVERAAAEQRRAAEKAAAEEERRRRVSAEEAALVEAASAPLRAYLLQHVMPVLMDGLMEVVHTQPEDPVDFLAEWLYRRATLTEDTEALRETQPTLS